MAFPSTRYSNRHNGDANGKSRLQGDVEGGREPGHLPTGDNPSKRHAICDATLNREGLECLTYGAVPNDQKVDNLVPAV